MEEARHKNTNITQTLQSIQHGRGTSVVETDKVTQELLFGEKILARVRWVGVPSFVCNLT